MGKPFFIPGCMRTGLPVPGNFYLPGRYGGPNFLIKFIPWCMTTDELTGVLNVQISIACPTES